MVVTAVVVGAGNRGLAYASYATARPERLKIVGVAEPREKVRSSFQARFSLPAERSFGDWKELLAVPKMADFVMVCTQDTMHKEPAIALAQHGYHILLEKPMATSEQDCIDIVEACKAARVLLAVCHVLRYAPVNQLIKRLIDDGTIGDLVNIQHLEPVGYFHFAHSFVRGNWRREDTSSFSLLTKSCHDIDLLCYWMGRKCERVSSFGSLQHFRAESKPEGAAANCLDCKYQSSCPYSALKYETSPFATTVKRDADMEDLRGALRSGPYGRCVYDCDNDVVDHQVVNMEFAGGRTASFSMIAFSEKLCVRQTVVHGTKGELRCEDGLTVRHFDFASETVRVLDSNTAFADWGHGGSDFYTVETFVNAVEKGDPTMLMTGGDDTLRSHRLTFAAERARKEGVVLRVDL